MKVLKLVFALFVTSLSFSATAQVENPAITVVKTIDLSADQVWEQIRVMDNIDQLSSLVAKVEWTGEHGVGGQRVCTSADGQGYFKESIVGFSDAERTYTYAVVEGVPAKNMVNNFKVVDLGYNKSMVVWTSSFEFVENPQMTEDQFKGFLTNAAGEMITNSFKLAKKA
ncbi:MAG: SRPBCC family protein [Bacteroidota bacterium]